MKTRLTVGSTGVMLALAALAALALDSRALATKPAKGVEFKKLKTVGTLRGIPAHRLRGRAAQRRDLRSSHAGNRVR